jgi:hypothetical protein
LGIALIIAALVAFSALGLFYFGSSHRPQLDAKTLCPLGGPHGINVILVDTSDDLPDTTKRQVLGILDDLITGLPEYYRLDIRVLDIPGTRSRSLFAKCNPGDGASLSEWKDNPRIARKRWIEAFKKPAINAVGSSVAEAKATSSPIMGAIQDIAVDQFSSAAAQSVPKSLYVISDMIEFTQAYSQYPAAGDLSYQRFNRSPAYLKFRTDLHGTNVTIHYVQRPSARIDVKRHPDFWNDWFKDNRSGDIRIIRLQGAN